MIDDFDPDMEDNDIKSLQLFLKKVSPSSDASSDYETVDEEEDGDDENGDENDSEYEENGRGLTPRSTIMRISTH